MANKVYNLSGGLYSGDAFTAFESDSTMSNTTDLNGAVANSYSYQVSAGTGMTLKINPGSAIISNGVGSGIRVGSDSENTVTVSAASTANPRVDSVVMYIDNSVASSTSVVDNVDLGILKFAVVAGTPAASPSAPTTSAIQTAIGAGNPYMLLADIKVPKSATAASSFGFSDKRKTSVESLLYNVRPESDTPAGWQKAIGDKKHATIWYDMKDCFAAQPSQWGLLTIDCAGSNVVLQSWKQTGASTPELRRTGNTAGKWDSDFHGVTSSMIDWTTLTRSWWGGTLANNTTETVVGSITLPAGEWLLNLTGQIDSGGQSGTKYMQVKNGSATVADCRLWGANLAVTLSNTRRVVLSAQTTLNIVTYSETSGSRWYDASLIAQRIA